MEDLSERRAAFDRFFARSGPELDDMGELRAMVGRVLARQALWRASRAVDLGQVDGADAVPVDELVAFAHDVSPEVRRLREWHGFRLRRLIGAGRSMWFLPFVATGAAHRLRFHLGQMRWRARGT